MVVLLPAPFGPSNPNTSPDSTPNETAFTAVISPKVRVSWLVSSVSITSSLYRFRPHQPFPPVDPSLPLFPPRHLHGRHRGPSRRSAARFRAPALRSPAAQRRAALVNLPARAGCIG